MTRVKICGITNKSDALAAVSLGADAVGFVLAPGPRRIEAARVREICDVLPPLVARIGVFVDETTETIIKTARSCRLTAVQLHGNETKSQIDEIECPVIKAFRVRDGAVVKDIKRFGLTYFLLDTYCVAQVGGTGKIFDWDIARQAKELGHVILAGGLNAENIEEALETVKPFAVDINSGVEASPGKKDIRKMETLIRKVRLWDNRTH